MIDATAGQTVKKWRFFVFFFFFFFLFVYFLCFFFVCFVFERDTASPSATRISIPARVALGHEKGHIYSRNTNRRCAPSRRRCAIWRRRRPRPALHRHGRHQRDFLHLSAAGERVVSIKDTMGGTKQAVHGIPARIRHRGDSVHDRRSRGDRGEIARGCKLLYLETPTNPTVKITTSPASRPRPIRVGALVAVDNTLPRPSIKIR